MLMAIGGVKERESLQVGIWYNGRMQEEKNETRNFGPQPLDEVLEVHGISNHRLVEASTEHLTHKVVQKARKGRWLTPQMRRKVTRAVNSCGLDGVQFTVEQLFNYADQPRPGFGDVVLEDREGFQLKSWG